MAGTKLWDNPVLGGMGGAIRALAKNVANRLPMDRTALKRVVAKVIAEQRNLNHIGDVNGHKYYLKNETFYMPDMVTQAKEALDDMLLIEKNRLRKPAVKFCWKPPDEDNTKVPSVSEQMTSLDNPDYEGPAPKRAKDAAGIAKTAIGLRHRAGAVRLGKQPSPRSRKVPQNLQKNLFQLTPKKVNPQSAVPDFVDLKITKSVTPAVKRKLRKPKLQSPVMRASKLLAQRSKHSVATESPKRQKKKSAKKLAAPVVKAAKTSFKALSAKPSKSAAFVTKTPKFNKPYAPKLTKIKALAASSAKPVKQPTKVVNVSKPAANLPKKSAADADLAKALAENNKSIPKLRSVLTAPLRLKAGKSKVQFSNRVQPLKKSQQDTPRAKKKPLRRCYSKPWLPRRLKHTKSQTNSNPNLLQSAKLPQCNDQPTTQKDATFSPSMPWHEFRGAAAVKRSPYQNLNQAQTKPPKKQETRMRGGQAASQDSPLPAAAQDLQPKLGVTQKPPLKCKVYKCSQRLENLAKPKARADSIKMRTAQSQMSVQKLPTPTKKPSYKQSKHLKVGSVGSLQYLVPSETSAANRNFSPAGQNLSIAFLNNRRSRSPRSSMRWRW